MGKGALVSLEAAMTVKLITIFGGSGFVGRNTVRALARAGYRLRVAVRWPHTAHFLRPMGDVGQIEIVQANIRNEDSVRRALDGADGVVNLVGILYQTRRQKFADIHDDGAERIARLARRSGVATFVHMSAIGADLNSRSRYGRSKAAGEAKVREVFPDATILRPSVIFGAEDDLFNRFAGLAQIAPALPLIGGGDTRFQPVFVGDVAAAVKKCIEQPSARGRVYELGGPSIYTFKELMTYMLDTIGRRRLLVPLPFGLATFMGFFLGLWPKPLLTMDQVALLKTDNVVGRGPQRVATFADLGIQPVAMDTVVPSYLRRFRRHGQFEESAI